MSSMHFSDLALEDF